ncbi:MAG TPA: hypothetical protein VM557_06450, partial [Thermoanaerobaculia bacterium]|nr:hypothetical protein [Thermoanaerobaculia bacterium]
MSEDESRRRVLVMSRHEATKTAMRELLDQDCCEVLSEATGQETKLALDEFSLVVVDATESWAD